MAGSDNDGGSEWNRRIHTPMTKLRKESRDYPSYSKPLRIVASGTLFLTHTLSIPSHPAPSTVVRAHSVVKTRGGSASSLLSLLAQFPRVEAALVASLGGNDEGQILIQDLESEGVSTRFCKVWKDVGVPSAWVLHASENNTRTVINHNPLPDITHEEFVSLLGPMLAPENYFTTTPPVTPPSQPSTPPVTNAPRTSSAGNLPPAPMVMSTNPNSPAPFDWIHFEGRSVKTTLTNIIGLDGLARERKWRSHCVFSIDVGRRGRQGIEALIPHADILFFNKHYAQASSPHYASSPRAFLLSLMSKAPPHALLVAYWGTEGGAALSIPTKEYFQSSGWVEDRRMAANGARKPPGRQGGLNPDGIAVSEEIRSVRTGSDFWADGRSRSSSSSAYTARENSSYMDDSFSRGGTSVGPNSLAHSRYEEGDGEDDDNDSQETEVPDEDVDDSIVDEVGAQDAFVTGMIYALSRKIAPGPPYTPSAGGEDTGDRDDRGRWRQLDECLRFATELSGRKARRHHWNGLAREMATAGWFNE
ncbi:hypothetical protein K435DRAFT_772751 [Dendrothele bispora CBS 962.96]|uniref:Carbohydrate kinase PfkB domain-containing protein n=1 Tax=Dendrothele bispora (strain CBS 962.96) TaxID=1314807 RepID=A0A4S8MVU2_DENBC|nr:hypothetical protein K435DRAFT_772751 [Dendrothele bispora CBS 962.96]